MTVGNVCVRHSKSLYTLLLPLSHRTRAYPLFEKEGGIRSPEKAISLSESILVHKSSERRRNEDFILIPTATIVIRQELIIILILHYLRLPCTLLEVVSTPFLLKEKWERFFSRSEKDPTGFFKTRALAARRMSSSRFLAEDNLC